MLGRTKQQGGLKNGEFYALAAEAYVGGSPAAIDSAGKLTLALSTTEAAFVGIFANSATVDGVTATADALATFYTGPLIVALDNSDGDTNPLLTTDTFAAADPLYISTAGLWTKTAVSGQSPKGVVMSITTATGASASIVALFFAGNISVVTP